MRAAGRSQDVRATPGEGIHAASGGVWRRVFGFAGVRLTPSGPIVETHLPTGHA